MLGYCCTGSDIKARAPTSTMTRMTTNARTGCLMKISVKARMSGSLEWGRKLKRRLEPEARPAHLHPCSLCPLSSFPIPYLRHRLLRCCDRHERGITQLEGSRGGHPLSRCKPRTDDDFIRQGSFDRDLTLTRTRCTLLVRLDDKNEISERSFS